MQSTKSIILIAGTVLSLSANARNFGLSLGAFFNSISTLRGAKTWPKASLMAGPSFTFFEKLSVRGPSLGYSHFKREDPFEFELGARLIDDDEPLFSLGSHNEDFRNQRDSTWELSSRFRYKFGFMNKFHIGGLIARDIDETNSFYSELHLGAPLFIYTTLNYRLGLGEKKSNRYYYGPEAVSGLGWQEFSIKYVMPFVPWEGIVINTFAYSKVLQEANQTANLVRADESHLSLSTVIIWNLL